MQQKVLLFSLLITTCTASLFSVRDPKLIATKKTLKNNDEKKGYNDGIQHALGQKPLGKDWKNDLKKKNNNSENYVNGFDLGYLHGKVAVFRNKG